MAWKKRLAVLIVLAGLFPASAQYSDLPAGHWAKEAVEELTAKGILQGFPDGTFRGNDPVSRYQLALVVYRLLDTLMGELAKAVSAPGGGLGDPAVLDSLVKVMAGMGETLADLVARVSALERKEGATPSLLDPALAGSISALGSDLEALRQTVAHAEGKLVEWQALLEAMAAKVEELRAQAERASQGAEEARQEAEMALRTAGGTYQDLARLQELYGALAQEVASLRKEVGNLAARPLADEEARRRAEALLQAQAGILARLEALEGRLKSLEDKAPTLDWSAAGLLLLGSGASWNLDALPLPGGDGTPLPDTRSRGSLGLALTVSLEGKAYTLRVGAGLGGLGPTPEVAFAYQDGAFGLRAGYGYQTFSLHPYLLRNAKGVQDLLGLHLEGKAGEDLGFRFLYGAVHPGLDPNPALVGNLTAFRLQAGPLGLVYGEDGTRKALGAEVSLKGSPFSLEGAWAASTASSWASLFSPSSSPWAYHLALGVDLGAFRAKGAYSAVDPTYGNGQAGLSPDADTGLLGGEDYPYPAGYRGFSLSWEGEYLGLALKGVGVLRGDYSGAPGSYGAGFTVAASLPLFGLRLTPFLGMAWDGGNGYGDPGSQAPYLPERYRHQDPLRAYASAYGLHLGLEAKPLALEATAAYHPVERALEGEVRLGLALGEGFRVQGSLQGDYSLAPGTDAGSSYFLGGHLAASLPVGPLSLEGRALYGSRTYRGDGGSVTSPTSTLEASFGLSARYRLSEASLLLGYGFRGGVGVPLLDPSYTDWSDFYRPHLPPWAVPPVSGRWWVSGYTVGLSLGHLEAAFTLLDGSQGEAKTFRLRYALPLGR